jgi:hypothetical protein
MKISIIPTKKIILLMATGGDAELFKILAGFAGDAIIFPKPNKSFFKAFITSKVTLIKIDMEHENITKEFIQLLLRSNK